MDESDEAEADQILTIDELRALRDRMGAEALAARRARSTAQVDVPAAPATVAREAPPEAWEDLPHEPRHRLYLPPSRWPRRLIALACVVLAGAVLTALMVKGRSAPRSAGEAAPAVSATLRPSAAPPPVVPPPVVGVPTVATSSAPDAAPATPEPSAAPAPPDAAAPDGSAEPTTRLTAAIKPAPRPAARRPAPPAPPPVPAATTDGRPPPTVVNLDQPRNGASATNSAGQPSCAGGCTVTPAPTSWSPSAPP